MKKSMVALGIAAVCFAGPLAAAAKTGAVTAAAKDVTEAHKPGGADTAEARKAIEETNLRFGDGIAKGDAASLAALYTEDAIVMPPDGEMVHGRKAIEEFWTIALKNGLRSGTLTTVDVGRRGDTAYEVGKFSMTVQPEGKDAATASGKYLVVWRKKDGAWRLHRDIWNRSPMPSDKRPRS